MKYILFVMLIISIDVRSEDTSLLILGGGGEPSGDTTIFDSSIKKFKDYSSSKKFKEITVSFNGGHKETEKILEDSFKGSTNSSFTKNNFKEKIKQYEDAIGNGKYKAGDQIMIFIDTHGAVKTKINGEEELTHSIATSGGNARDLDNLSGAGTTSMDALKDLTKIALTNHVKLAIIDMLCHSGNSLSLANENTCVISSTGPNHYGYAGKNTFSENLIDGLKGGKNLEEVFLEARENSDDLGFPMISTPESKTIVEDIYSRISPYLFYHSAKSDKLSGYVKRASEEENLSCKKEKELTALTKLIEDVEKVNTVQKQFLWFKYQSKDLDLTNLKENLKKYKEDQDRLIANEKLLKSDEYQVEFEISNSDYSRTEALKLREIVSSDYSNQIKDLEKKIDKEDKEDQKDYLRRELEFFMNAKNKQMELVKANPRLQELVIENDKIRTDSYRSAEKIALDEKKLFSSLYKDQEKINPESKNPCKDFKL